MNVGDLVKLAFHVTRRGYHHEDEIGIVVCVKNSPGKHKEIAVVNFAGGIIKEYPASYLRVIYEQ